MKRSFTICMSLSMIISSFSWICAQTAPWPMFRHDPGHTGRSPYRGSDTGILAWSYNTGNDVTSSPSIEPGGRLFVGSYSNSIYAFTPEGSLAWSYFANIWINYSSPAIAADGRIFIGSNDDRLYALTSSGSLLWSYHTAGGVESSPSLRSGRLFVGSDYYVYSLTSGGSFQWSYETNDYVRSSPAAGSDLRTCTGSDDYNVYVLDSQGGLLWSYDTDGEVSSSPALGTEGNVYVGGYADTFFAFNSIGSLLWSYEVGYYIDYSSPAIGTNGRLYIGSAGDPDNLYAFESTRTLAWSYAGGQDIDTSPALGSDGIVYAASEGNEIFALSSTGTLVWSYMTGDWISSSPSIGSDGKVCIGSNDNRLYAFQGPATVTPTPTVTPTRTPTPTATPSPTPNYINLGAAPPAVPPGGQVTMTWACDFGIWDYQGKVVHVYVAAIKNPKVTDAPSSVSDALSGNPVYLFGKNMQSAYLYTGTIKEPTFSGAVFPPSPVTGSQNIPVPADPSLIGDWVLATAFAYESGAFVRNDDSPVENSNLFRIQ